jgi:tRNA-(ms[2]io[6]A)-hydroxylase
MSLKICYPVPELLYCKNQRTSAQNGSHMLYLTKETKESWKVQALAHVEDLLIDHAHCEKKAASTALNLIFKYPEYDAILMPLSAIAREELSHFELVLDFLKQRHIPFVRQKPSAYAGKLIEVVRKEEPVRFLDTLLCCALIEARSCERMQLLVEAFQERDPALAKLYEGLLASEARHFSTYVDLANQYFNPAQVKERLREISAHESAILDQETDELRMHS